jgi:hypothetical protein
VVEVTNRRTPFYDLARELAYMGYGEWRLQVFTPQGTPSLSGIVGKLAGLTVEERDRGGLRLAKHRPFPLRGRPTDAQVGSEGPRVPETEDARLRA